MSKFVDRPRYTCALGGALLTLRALPRTIPIIHASTGCGYNIYNATNSGSGYIGGGYCGGSSWSSTNVVEKEIVFGGEDRLREQIRTTIEIMDGDLYVVVTGCMVEMIGDDASSVTSEFNEYPVIAVSTPSFKGNSYVGYDMVLTELFKYFVTKGLKKQKGVVNVFGLVPGQDVFYKGNLAEIKRLLEKIGLTVNTFFGENETIDSLKNSSKAELNIILSDTYGISSAKIFEEVHSTPYITTGLPVGATQTAEFLCKVADTLGIPKKIVDKTILSEDIRYYDYLERIADIYFDIDLSRYAVLIGDANYVPAISRFISDEFGWIPLVAQITDFITDDEKEIITAKFENWESTTVPTVVFDTDASALVKHIQKRWGQSNNQKYYDTLGPAVIIGSVLERDLSTKFGFPLLAVTYPVTSRVVLNQGYAGYTGGLNLVSDLVTLQISGR
ncbi:MAG: hypothetical protein LBT51_03430 [Fusobacteriaceae bacterium]|nr:hypothetical protein [Fusobacteriaceae bacterium]